MDRDRPAESNSSGPLRRNFHCVPGCVRLFTAARTCWQILRRTLSAFEVCPKEDFPANRLEPIPFQARHLSALASVLRQIHPPAARPSARLDRERPDPPQHRPEPTPCQMTLRQEQPVVPRVFHQAPTGLDKGCCMLVSDQLSIRLGSTKAALQRGRRPPRLIALYSEVPKSILKYQQFQYGRGVLAKPSAGAIRGLHAVNPDESRSCRIDSRKPAIWFQLRVVEDALNRRLRAGPHRESRAHRVSLAFHANGLESRPREHRGMAS